MRHMRRELEQPTAEPSHSLAFGQVPQACGQAATHAAVAVQGQALIDAMAGGAANVSAGPCVPAASAGKSVRAPGIAASVP